MKKCKIVGCNEKSGTKGLCKKHYSKAVLQGTAFWKGICSMDDCNKSIYRNNFCRNHFLKFKRSGHPDGVYDKCILENCNNTSKRGEFCGFHQERIKNNIPLNAPKNWNHSRERNSKWKNGASDYPNHYQMKKNRLIKLQQTQGKCEVCGCDKGIYTHHKDGTKINHELDNLILLCRKCHGDMHKDTPHRSKFRKIYGMTMKEISDKYNVPIQKVVVMHETGNLVDLIKPT